MSNRSTVRPSWIWVAVLLALTAGACSVEETLPAPNCQSGETAIIGAQSVPSAAFLPCLTSIPTGWKVDTVNINQDGTVIRFDSDRAGAGAAVLRYDKSCDTGDAVTAPSDQPGAKRYDLVERIEPGFRAERYYVFSGGCIWWTFDFDDDALVLFSRDALNQSIRESFIDADI